MQNEARYKDFNATYQYVATDTPNLRHFPTQSRHNTRKP